MRTAYGTDWGQRQFLVLSALQEKHTDPRSILRTRTELSLWRFMPLASWRNRTGQKGNFGEGRAIAGERIWNTT
jgi:hypothetical protein